MQTVNACPVCENRQLEKVLSCLDYTVSHETFHIAKCSHCNFLITTPRPSDEELGKYYISNNYISHSNNANSFIDKIYKLSRHFTLQWKYQIIAKNISPSKDFTILDFGCGTGAFLKKCKENGTTIAGVEPSTSARTIAIQALNQPIYENLKEVNQTFNAITLWHVLEHVSTLNDTIQNLKSKLDEHGTMFIAVPNFESEDAKKYGKFWAGYDVPRHLWHFSKRSIQLFLEKNGLKLIKILPMKLDAFYVSMLSEKYRKGKPTISGMMLGATSGLQSNLKAANDNNSSLIYIARKQ
jgi:SAM-dependent methyltransferase